MTDPRPEPYPAPTAPASANGLATGALIAALVVLVLGIVQQFGFLLVTAADFGIPAYSGFTTVLTVLIAIAAIAALVLGLVALSQPGGRRLRTGIALGIGGSALVSIIVNFVVGAVASVF